MYEHVLNINKSTDNQNIKSELEYSIFENIIVPFYDNLKKLENSLYTINQYIVSCKNYDKEILNKQLQSTADYINDILSNSKISMYNYYNNYSQINDKEMPTENRIINKYTFNKEFYDDDFC